MGWASIGFQSVIVAFASYLAWFWLLGHYPATRLSAFSFLTPIFGLLLAAVALGESISVRLIVAMLFIAVGITLVNRKSRGRGHRVLTGDPTPRPVTGAWLGIGHGFALQFDACCSSSDSTSQVNLSGGSLPRKR